MLYKHKEVVGEVLGYDADGNAAFKAGDNVTLVPRDELTKVMPHTVAVRFLPGQKLYHFQIKKGVKVGDILLRTTPAKNGLSDLAIVQVVELDTQAENTIPFEGVRLETHEV